MVKFTFLGIVRECFVLSKQVFIFPTYMDLIGIHENCNYFIGKHFQECLFGLWSWTEQRDIVQSFMLGTCYLSAKCNQLWRCGDSNTKWGQVFTHLEYLSLLASYRLSILSLVSLPLSLPVCSISPLLYLQFIIFKELWNYQVFL